MKSSLPDQMLYLLYPNIRTIVNDIKVEYIYLERKKKFYFFLLVSPTTTIYRGLIPNGSTNAVVSS